MHAKHPLMIEYNIIMRVEVVILRQSRNVEFSKNAIKL